MRGPRVVHVCCACRVWVWACGAGWGYSPCNGPAVAEQPGAQKTTPCKLSRPVQHVHALSLTSMPNAVPFWRTGRPFGACRGMDVVDRLYDGYGEMDEPDACRHPQTELCKGPKVRVPAVCTSLCHGGFGQAKPTPRRPWGCAPCSAAAATTPAAPLLRFPRRGGRSVRCGHRHRAAPHECHVVPARRCPRVR